LRFDSHKTNYLNYFLAPSTIYKKPTLIQRFLNFIDKLTGGADEMTSAQEKYIDERFNDVGVFKQRKKRRH